MQPSKQILNLFQTIQLALFDVDGVFTDGRITYTDSGQESKTFHTQDGAAIKMLQSTGVQVAIITGRKSEMVSRRTAELGIHHVYQGISDKNTALEDLHNRLGIAPKFMSHTGDDIADLVLFNKVGLKISVPGAHPEVLSQADYVTQASPGLGAVREICHTIMLAQGSWGKVLQSYTE